MALAIYAALGRQIFDNGKDVFHPQRLCIAFSNGEQSINVGMFTRVGARIYCVLGKYFQALLGSIDSCKSLQACLVGGRHSLLQGRQLGLQGGNLGCQRLGVLCNCLERCCLLPSTPMQVSKGMCSALCPSA